MASPAWDRRVTGELVRYDAMCQAIASAYDVDEVKDIRDRAAALEHYSRQAHNIEAERQCCEIRLRAERKAGKLLQQIERAQGQRTDLPTSVHHGPKSFSVQIEEHDISPKQAKQWQKLAAVPDDQFERALTGSDKPTTNGIIQSAKPVEVTPVSDQALWLWGRLRDFERHGLLPSEPPSVLATMTPTMLQDVIELAPRVADWLKRIGGNDGA